MNKKTPLTVSLLVSLVPMSASTIIILSRTAMYDAKQALISQAKKLPTHSILNVKANADSSKADVLVNPAIAMPHPTVQKGL